MAISPNVCFDALFITHLAYPLFRPLVAEAEKAGIEEAGGKADIFQYVRSHCPIKFL